MYLYDCRKLSIFAHLYCVYLITDIHSSIDCFSNSPASLFCQLPQQVFDFLCTFHYIPLSVHRCEVSSTVMLDFFDIFSSALSIALFWLLFNFKLLFSACVRIFITLVLRCCMQHMSQIAYAVQLFLCLLYALLLGSHGVVKMALLLQQKLHNKFVW